jgi:uncharacterized membrane protein
LVAIVAMLSSLKQVAEFKRIAHFVLAGFTVVNSWMLVPTMFTTVYAGMYYSTEEDERPLLFPQTLQPVFWDSRSTSRPGCWGRTERCKRTHR